MTQAANANTVFEPRLQEFVNWTRQLLQEAPIEEVILSHWLSQRQEFLSNPCLKSSAHYALFKDQGEQMAHKIQQQLEVLEDEVLWIQDLQSRLRDYQFPIVHTASGQHEHDA